MSKQCVNTTGFSLAKGKQLVGDDFFGVKTIGDLTVAIVCDGVGSAQEGALAAKRVVNYMINNFKNLPITWSIEKSIKTFINSINSILYEESIINYGRAELVTTLAIVVIKGNRLYGANVGDSRIYLQRDGSLIQLSHDHIVNEEGFDGVLSRAIGIDKSVMPYYFENIINQKDKILLCSDGLYTLMSEEMLSKNIAFGASALVKKASKITKDNLPDDTTAVIVEVLGVNQVEELKQLNLKIADSLKEGMLIDGYILEKSLIQNNRTWIASKKGKQYVLKFAPLEAKDDPKILDMFVKEAWNSKRLKAGFFPKAVIPKRRTYRYYVMNKIDGIDLKTYIKKRALSIEDAVNLGKMLLKMAQYLLKFDLVHADIKPENIMVLERDGKHTFKVIDFGSVREIYSTNSKAGTPSYISPERFIGGFINESSEIFSIGVTLYEALTKRFPYGEIEPFQQPTFKTPPPPDKFNKNIPHWLNSIILRAIEKDANYRYKNYSEMLFELNNPNRVEPYFDKNSSLIERKPVLLYRVLFIISFVINLILLGVILN